MRIPTFWLISAGAAAIAVSVCAASSQRAQPSCLKVTDTPLVYPGFCKPQPQPEIDLDFTTLKVTNEFRGVYHGQHGSFYWGYDVVNHGNVSYITYDDGGKDIVTLYPNGKATILGTSPEGDVYEEIIADWYNLPDGRFVLELRGYGRLVYAAGSLSL